MANIKKRNIQQHPLLIVDTWQLIFDGVNGVNAEFWDEGDNASIQLDVNDFPETIFNGSADHSHMPAHVNGVADRNAIENIFTLTSETVPVAATGQDQSRAWAWIVIDKPIRIAQASLTEESLSVWLGQCGGIPEKIARQAYPANGELAEIRRL